MKHETHNKVKRIFLTGGGTGGSVTPLIAIASELENYKVHKVESKIKYEFLWIGTKNGLEKGMIESEKIKFISICSGKLRRYFSLQNFVDPFLVFLGFCQSIILILKHKPSLIISAGSFVSVPVVWAGWLLGVPSLIHQQDARPGLANKLMARFASIITTVFVKSVTDYKRKTVQVGNPARSKLLEFKTTKEEARQKLNLDKNKPTVLIVGGGTGAAAINKLVEEGIKDLVKFCQIIHITGKNKNRSNLASFEEAKLLRFYKQFEFLDTNAMAKAYKASDIVVSRCGMGVLTELSILAKPAILIPIPNSHQEDNAKVFSDQNAAIVLKQKELTKEKFVREIKNLINNKKLQEKLSSNIKEVIKNRASEKIIDIIKNLI